MVLEIQSWLAVTQYTTAVFQPQAVLPPLLEGETSYQLAWPIPCTRQCENGGEGDIRTDPMS